MSINVQQKNQEKDALETHIRKHIDFMFNNIKYNPNMITVDDVKQDILDIYASVGLSAPSEIIIAKSYDHEKAII